jgi:hypothetical protein
MHARGVGTMLVVLIMLVLRRVFVFGVAGRALAALA